MSKMEFIPPGEHDLWCNTTNTLFESTHFKSFLRIYNMHTAGTRAKGTEATIEHIKEDRNLRNRMRAFFRDEMRMTLVGAKHAEVILRISAIVESAMAILDERNKLLASGEITKGEIEAERMLNRRLSA